MMTGKGAELPDDLVAALREQPRLLAVLEHMRPSCRRGYAEWLDQAADPATRARRVDRVLAKIARWGEHHALIPAQTE